MSSGGEKKLIVICGPTAVGKTDFSISLAEHLATEIISADSRQVYRELPIGTAQPSAGYLARVKHHFIAERSVADDYNAGMFERDALQRMALLFKEHETVVCCGGTGLYIKALCQGMDELPTADAAIRQHLTQRWETEGLSALQTELRQLDPVHFAKMDTQNPQRVIRALEVCLSTGRPFSSFHGKQRAERPFKVVKVGLQLPREELNARIDARVEQMIQSGWLQEAEAVFGQRHLNALNTVGYKELFAHLEGKLTLEEAVIQIKTNTRQFAKRQMTWFNKDAEIRWLEEVGFKAVVALLH
jgi:tRNA dimethylallyltransferase